VSSPETSGLLATLDDLAARRPVAARVVAIADDPTTGARDLASVLTADVTLTARVLRVANSASFGLGGRVRSVPFAVTVVGFTTVRAIAAVAAAGVDAAEGLPEDFWSRCKVTAVACGELAGAFGVSGPDAFCLGLLSGLGQAVLCQHDPQGYAELLATDAVRTGGRAALVLAEEQRYGLRHTEVSAAALASWAFPRELTEALGAVDGPQRGLSGWVLCLRAAMEVAGRVVAPDQPRTDLGELSGGAVREARSEDLLVQVREAIARSRW
jgi:HD-like signal output (HDOD) protein